MGLLETACAVPELAQNVRYGQRDVQDAYDQSVLEQQES